MPGMMTAEDMDALQKASDEEFQGMWLEMMVEHHQGAMEMAETEQSEGSPRARCRSLSRSRARSRLRSIRWSSCSAVDQLRGPVARHRRATMVR